MEKREMEHKHATIQQRVSVLAFERRKAGGFLNLRGASVFFNSSLCDT